MIYLLAILTGLVIGAALQRWSRYLARVSRAGLPLLLLVIFLMGTEVDLRLLDPALVWRATILGLSTMVGSVLCLTLVLLFLRLHHGR